jgi:hypothetical protein
MRLAIPSCSALLGFALLAAPAGGHDAGPPGWRGRVIAGALAPGRVNRHRIFLRAGELLTASLRESGAGEFHDPLLGVLAPSGGAKPVAADDDGGPGFLPRLALRAAETGWFTVLVTGFGDEDFDGTGSTETLRYRLVLAVEQDPPRVVEREPGADPMRLRRGATLVSGHLAPGDTDAFELWLDPGATLTASVFESGRGEFHDPVLRLIDASGQLLAQNDDGGPGFLANLAYQAKRIGRGWRPAPLRLELAGFDPDGTGAATASEDFDYQLVISIDHFQK